MDVSKLMRQTYGSGVSEAMLSGRKATLRERVMHIVSHSYDRRGASMGTLFNRLRREPRQAVIDEVQWLVDHGKVTVETEPRAGNAKPVLWVRAAE